MTIPAKPNTPTHSCPGRCGLQVAHHQFACVSDNTKIEWSAELISVRPWWRGLTGDHVYEGCPGRLRSLPALVKAGWDEASATCSLCPEGGDVCGWCLRVWRARSAGGRAWYRNNRVAPTPDVTA